MKEALIQSQILSWLTAEKIWHRRIPLGPVSHGGVRKKNPLRGMPDIIGIIPDSPGRMFAIEVKTQEGVLSPIQEETIKELEGEGVLVILARSLEDVRAYLDPALNIHVASGT